MKKLKFIFMFLFAILFSFYSYSQENIIEQSTTPQASFVFKTPVQKNTLIEQVNLLTNYDEQLTEKVIYQLYLNNNFQEFSIITDEKYENLNEKQKLFFVKESEVKQIINDFK